MTEVLDGATEAQLKEVPSSRLAVDRERSAADVSAFVEQLRDLALVADTR